MGRHLLTTLAGMLLCACMEPRENDAGKATDTATSQALVTEGFGAPYILLGSGDRGESWRRLDVRLEQRLSEEDLVALGRRIRDSTSVSEDPVTTIHYYLPAMTVGGGAWARAELLPTPIVTVYGLTHGAARALAAEGPSANQEVIGRWLDDLGRSRLTIYRQDNRLYLENASSPDASFSEQLVERASSRGRRFNSRDKEGIDYYIVRPDGSLEIWDTEGLIRQASAVPPGG